MRTSSLIFFLLCLFTCFSISAQQGCEDGMLSEVYDITLCPGESFNGYDTSGIYYDTIAISPHCDLIRTFVISVYALAPETILGIGNDFCDEINQDSLFLIAPFDALGGCNLIPEISLPNFDGIILRDTICYAQSDMTLEPGFYFDLETGNPNCDSSTLLIVVPVPENISSSYSLCELADFQVPLVDTSGQEITEVGLYTIDRSTTGGCAFLEEVEIRAAAVPSDLSIDTTICSGAYLYGLTETGSYTVERKDINGCKFNIFVDLTVLPPVPDVITNATICESDFDGIIPEPIESIDANGCPYLEILNLTIQAQLPDLVAVVEICEGEEFEGHTTTGIYTTIRLDANGCEYNEIIELTVIPLADCNTSIQDVAKANDFILTPNPTQATLRLQSNINPSDFQGYQILDLMGRIVKSSETLPATNLINLSQLSNGTYLFSLKTKGQVITKKIIKL